MLRNQIGTSNIIIKTSERNIQTGGIYFLFKSVLIKDNFGIKY